MVVLDMEKTAGTVTINRKYDPLDLDFHGIPVRSGRYPLAAKSMGAVTANPDSRPGTMRVY